MWQTQLEGLLLAGRKLEAIRLYRNETAASLTEAAAAMNEKQLQLESMGHVFPLEPAWKSGVGLIGLILAVFLVLFTPVILIENWARHAWGPVGRSVVSDLAMLLAFTLGLRFISRNKTGSIRHVIPQVPPRPKSWVGFVVRLWGLLLAVFAPAILITAWTKHSSGPAGLKLLHTVCHELISFLSFFRV